MYCRNCGSSLPDGSKFCTQCGAQQAPSATSGSYRSSQQPVNTGYQQAYRQQPNTGYRQPNSGYQQSNTGYQQSNTGYQQQYQQPVNVYRPSRQTPVPSMNMGEAVSAYFHGYVDFKGRARRSEYWWSSLAVFLISLALALILPDLSGLWSLATFLPGLACSVRRLHDIGKSGWFVLVSFIPLVGLILILVWTCTDSEGDNQWGPSPKY